MNLHTPVITTQTTKLQNAIVFCTLILMVLISTIALAQQPQTSKFVGQRLIELVPDDPNVSPLPNALQKALPECKFQKTADSVTTFSQKCSLVMPRAGNARKFEPGVEIIAETPRCCLGSVLIKQTRLDHEGGLYLFDGLPGVELKELQCPDQDHQKFALVLEKGKPKFVIAEFRSSGSAGTTVDTTVFYGTTAARCDFFAEREKIFSKVSIDLAKKSIR